MLHPAPAESADPDVLRAPGEPFQPEGGMKMLEGPLGTAAMKVSAVSEDRHRVTGPAKVFDSQDAVREAYAAGSLTGDYLRRTVPGPRANKCRNCMG